MLNAEPMDGRQEWIDDARGLMGQVETTTLPVSELKVDFSYQRQPSKEKIHAIATHFNPHACGTLVVNLRDDGYYVVDGNHRREAMLKAGITEALCMVAVGLSPEEESRIFLWCNKWRKPPRAADTFRARLRHSETQAVSINSIIESVGWNLDLDWQHIKKKAVGAISALEEVYERHGADVLVKTLRLINAIWPEDRDARKATMIRGFGHFLKLYPEVADKEFAEKFGGVPVVRIQQRAGAYQLQMGGSGQMRRYVSMAIWDMYNHRKKNKLPSRYERGD